MAPSIEASSLSFCATSEQAEAYRVEKIAEYERAGNSELANWMREMDPIELRHRLSAELRDREKSAEDHETEREALRQRLEERWYRLTQNRERYRSCRLGNYIIDHGAQRAAFERVKEFADAIIENVAAGRNIVLFGTVGTGKDHLLAGLLHHALVAFDGKIQLEWTRGVDIVANAKEELGRRPTGWSDRAKTPSVLAISDPCCPGDELLWYSRQRLYQLVDDAYNGRRSVWITVNSSKREHLESMLGPQITDRLLDDCASIFCEWPSYRRLPGDRRHGE